MSKLKVKECDACGQGFAEDNTPVGDAILSIKCTFNKSLNRIVHGGSFIRLGVPAVPQVDMVNFYVNFTYREDSHQLPLQLPVSSEATLVAAVHEAIQSLNISKPRSFESFILENHRGELITSTSMVAKNETLYFYSPKTIIPVSSSSWTPSLLKQLNVRIVQVTRNSFFHEFGIIDDDVLSSRANQLIIDLAKVNYELIHDYYSTDNQIQVELRQSTLHCHSMVKALFLIEKYPSCEPLVDSFLSKLLSALGYDDGMLYVAPQFKMKLHFGGSGNDKESVPDFAVMDILSDLKMVIIKEKNWNETGKYSFPQLFADLTAMLAANQAKEEQDVKKSRIEEQEPPIALGIRVNGTVFHFHGARHSPAVYTAMESLQEAASPTDTIRLGGENGYNFLIPSQRKVIIYLLDKFVNRFTIH